MKFLRSFFRLPTPHELAARELAEAQRQLLAARSNLELASSHVTFRVNQTTRLEKFLASPETPAS